jgi:hypothetical protein
VDFGRRFVRTYGGITPTPYWQYYEIGICKRPCVHLSIVLARASAGLKTTQPAAWRLEIRCIAPGFAIFVFSWRLVSVVFTSARHGATTTPDRSIICQGGHHQHSLSPLRTTCLNKTLCKVRFGQRHLLDYLDDFQTYHIWR